MGFLPLARPTARLADALPIARASWPYDAGISIGNSFQRGPHPALELRAGRLEREIEGCQPAGEVILELPDGRRERLARRITGAAKSVAGRLAPFGVHVQARQLAMLGYQGEGSYGARYDDVRALRDDTVRADHD